MDLELFAGAGGWSQGRLLAGATGPVVGIELDHQACRTATTAGHPRVRAFATATRPTRAPHPGTGTVRAVSPSSAVTPCECPWRRPGCCSRSLVLGIQHLR